MSDALQTVMRIRKLAVDEAKRALVEALNVEDHARRVADAAEARIGIEGQIAADLETGDGAVEAFAAWWPTGRAIAMRTRTAHEHTLLEVARARAGLTATRAAAEAAESLQERRQAEQALEATRCSQAVMDEIASQQAARTKQL